MKTILIVLTIMLMSGYYLYTHQEPETITVVSYGDTVQDSKVTNIHSNMDVIYIIGVLFLAIILILLYHRKPKQEPVQW